MAVQVTWIWVVVTSLGYGLSLYQALTNLVMTYLHTDIIFILYIPMHIIYTYIVSYPSIPPS